MKKHTILSTPFAIHLSYLIKETKLRLCNISQWKKKRPSKVLILFPALVALLCGCLVSCQPSQDEQSAYNNIVSPALDDTKPNISMHEEPTGNLEEVDYPTIDPKNTSDFPSQNEMDKDVKATQPPESTTAIGAYKAVLRGEMEFRDTLSGKDFDISRVQEIITSDTSITIEPNYFTAVDLDADGTPEVILSLVINGSNSFGYLVLRYQDSIVYGYTFAQRELSEIRTDGTFEASGGAADVGICRITFDKDSYLIDKFTYHETHEDSENGFSNSYFVDHRMVEQAEYDQAYNKWKEIPYVKWYELTDDNIDLY